MDLEYPSELHELLKDYLLAPEKLKISQHILSVYFFIITKEYRIKIGGVNKLVQHLGNKSNYVLHYKKIQLYFSLGMKLTKVHRILKFKQSDWLKKYIDFNTDKGKMQLIILKKTFFKLMNNKVIGKTIENE